MQLEARRKAVRGEIKPVGIPPGRPSIFPPRRPQRAPVRAVAIARRRHLAASGPMPPALACKFTTGELAVLRIVGDEVRAGGLCAHVSTRSRPGPGCAGGGSERHPAGGASRAAHDPGATARGPEEPAQHRPGGLPGVDRVAADTSAPHDCDAGERGHSARQQIGCRKYHPTANKLEKKARLRRKELPTKEAAGSRRGGEQGEGEGGDVVSRSRRDPVILGADGERR